MSRVTLGILAAFVCGLSGCDQRAATLTHTESREPCWRIYYMPPTEYRSWDRVWETRNTPVPLGSGYYFTTDSGRVVMVSGSVVIEQTTRSK